MKTAVVTDTNSGIFPSEAAELGIWSLGMPVLIDGVSRTEGVDLTDDEFYEALLSGVPVATSQPSPGDVAALWNSILESGYDQIIHIPMSSSLSNSYSSASLIASHFNGKVCVADNHSISLTQRATVLEARAMAAEGTPASYIRAQLELERDRSSIYLAVDTLEFLLRGGRVTPAAAKIGTLLKIKPVLSIQGGLLEPYSKEKGMKKALTKMTKATKSDAKKKLGLKGSEGLMLLAAGSRLSEEKKQQLLDAIGEEFPGMEVVYDRLPLSIAVHTGPDAMGVGVHAKHGF